MMAEQGPDQAGAYIWEMDVRIVNRFNLWDIVKGIIFFLPLIFIMFMGIALADNGLGPEALASGLKIFGFFCLSLLAFPPILLVISLFRCRQRFVITEDGASYSLAGLMGSFSAQNEWSVAWGKVIDLDIQPESRVITLKRPWWSLWIIRLFCTPENFPAVRDKATAWWHAARNRAQLPG